MAQSVDQQDEPAPPLWEAAFEPTPKVWGPRGDRFAWFMLRALVGAGEIPGQRDRAEAELLRGLQQVTRIDILAHRGEEGVFVPFFDHGGMSSGVIAPPVWLQTLLPLLLRRAGALAGPEWISSQMNLQARALALEIARCPEIARTETLPAHPCTTIVELQGRPDTPTRQLPEAWAGGLLTARVLYVSSNPSISEVGDSNSGAVAEAYPTAGWSDDDIASFITGRFDPASGSGWAVDDRFRRQDGTLSPKQVPYWREARKRTAELLGYEPDPQVDYAMSEVVRCKSKKETGVAAAAEVCADRYASRTFELCAAPVVVVVGAKARDRLAQIMELPEAFGRRGSPPWENTINVILSGVERLLVYLPHFTGMEAGGRSFTARFGESALPTLRAVALSEIGPQQYQHDVDYSTVIDQQVTGVAEGLPSVEVPSAARVYLEQRVAGLTPTDSAAHMDARGILLRLAPGRVYTVAEGGLFGWSLQARLDLVDGRPVLECLENSRMSGQLHYTLDEEGTRRSLPGQQTMLAMPANSTSHERERLKQEYFRYNRAVTANLSERGFA